METELEKSVASKLRSRFWNVFDTNDSGNQTSHIQKFDYQKQKTFHDFQNLEICVKETRRKLLSKTEIRRGTDSNNSHLFTTSGAERQSIYTRKTCIE